MVRGAASLEVLTPQNLRYCVKFPGSRPSPRQRGIIKECDLARRSLDGPRRSLARGLDPSELAILRQVSWVKTVPASAGRYQGMRPSEAEPRWSEAQPR